MNIAELNQMLWSLTVIFYASSLPQTREQNPLIDVFQVKSRKTPPHSEIILIKA